MESEKHFILECDAFRDIRDSYCSMLVSIPLHCIFSEGTIRRLGQVIINLSKKRIGLQKEKKQGSWESHRLFLVSWTLKYLSFIMEI